VIIVGGKEESMRVLDMLNKASRHLNSLGFVFIENHKDEKNALGHIQNLEEIAKVFKAEEIIFCSKDITAKEILGWMVKLGSKRFHYKIAPEASKFIIGSRS